ncbi:family 78 glycoside hydrolase catalytic domain [Agrobacterium pusense]|uniref:alpha-L-rhamnosidase n=1 Tax=Agrobacterium pusense TaxID=648995 RepID=U4Q4M6_9HYPH|nr:alpha-L-rhamnosidase [Agrobacterium pusense]CDI12198.1 Alpha-L-rhamnosidase [Agrobacterium pusense]
MNTEKAQARVALRWPNASQSSASMIAPRCDQGQGTQASYVAKDFEWIGAGDVAELYVSAQGLYRTFVNGMRVGDDLLTPGWTCYDHRLAYQVYDIAHLLKVGSNRIEIWLGDGWFRSQMMWVAKPIFNCWGSKIGAIAEVFVGKKSILETSDDWVSGFLPITKSGIYWGEDHDARIKPKDIDGVEVIDFDQKLLVPHEAAAVKELAPIRPIRRWHDKNSREIIDFGQNAAGYVRFVVEGEPGSTVAVEHSEVLGPDDQFDNRNYRSARAKLTYTLNGEGLETFAPMFTFMGFRYARLSLFGKVAMKSIEMIPISSLPETAGGVTTGLEVVDRLVLNTVWSQRANFIEIPTDCPQRDERMGWTGDAQVFANTACWLANSRDFFRKYLRDVMADQRSNGAISHFSPDPTRLHPIPGRGDWSGSTGWGDCITVIPWHLYRHYADKQILHETFPAMLKWLEFLWGISDGPIIHPTPVWGDQGFTFGDWLQPVGDSRKPRPTIADDCAATLYHFISTDIAAKVADVIAQPREAVRLRARADKIKDAFQAEYFSATGRIAGNDMTSWALAFEYDLVPAEHRAAGREYFRRSVEDAGGVIGTGFIGTPALLPALTKIGLGHLAESLFLNRRVPGWLYQVERGATSIWERWDSIGPDGTIFSPEMNSYNHYAYGAVCQWLFEHVGGLQPSLKHPGFEEIIIDPFVMPALTPFSVWHECRLGRIEAAWTVQGDKVRYELALPAQVRGLLLSSSHRTNVTVGGVKIDFQGDGMALGAGRHLIEFKIDQ